MTETNTAIAAAEGGAQKNLLKRFAPLGVIGAALAIFFALDGPQYISLDYLKQNREALSALVADNFVLTILGFIGVYAALVAISFPGASFLTIFGGFMFGTLTGGAAVVIGATIGAAVIFLAARYMFQDSLRKKAGPYMAKFEQGLKENELSYLFILRLVPLFPFFIVNVVPGLFDVKFRNYVLTTFFGIIPGSLVYASIGNGAGTLLEAGEDLTLKGAMFQPHVIIPVVGLIVLSMVPILYKKFFKTKTA